jgi:hypothetical protein
MYNLLISNKDELINNLFKNKLTIFYIIVGLTISYLLFNIITSTIKYPIVIILGIYITNKIIKFKNTT